MPRALSLSPLPKTTPSDHAVPCVQGVLESVNFPVDQLPLLEVIQTITEPLLAKLRFHFASGRPTDRIDQPDWLFETAARATKVFLEPPSDLYTCV